MTKKRVCFHLVSSNSQCLFHDASFHPHARECFYLQLHLLPQLKSKLLSDISLLFYSVSSKRWIWAEEKNATADVTFCCLLPMVIWELAETLFLLISHCSLETIWAIICMLGFVQPMEYTNYCVRLKGLSLTLRVSSPDHYLMTHLSDFWESVHGGVFILFSL